MLSHTYTDRVFTLLSPRYTIVIFHILISYETSGCSNLHSVVLCNWCYCPAPLSFKCKVTLLISRKISIYQCSVHRRKQSNFEFIGRDRNLSNIQIIIIFSLKSPYFFLNQFSCFCFSVSLIEIFKWILTTKLLYAGLGIELISSVIFGFWQNKNPYIRYPYKVGMKYFHR